MNQPMRMIVTIVERGAGNRVTAAYSKHAVLAHFRCEGRGTATSEILDILGLGSTEKDIVLSLTTRDAARALMRALDDDLGPALRTKGIAFTLRLTGLNSLVAASIQLNTKLEKNGESAMKQSDSSLILISVNQGFTGPVMETAKKAGARGGTILRARLAGSEELTATMQMRPEQEIIAIVAPTERRAAIMEAVNTAHGPRSEAGGVVLSMGVEQLTKI